MSKVSRHRANVKAKTGDMPLNDLTYLMHELAKEGTELVEAKRMLDAGTDNLSRIERRVVALRQVLKELEPDSSATPNYE